MFHHYLFLSGMFPQQRAPHPGGYLCGSANPFVPQVAFNAQEPALSLAFPRGMLRAPFPAPLSLPLPFRARVPMPPLPLPACNKAPLSLEELKTKSLNSLLTSVVAFLCTFEAARHEETTAGVLVSDLSRMFNDTFGRTSGSYGCIAADVPFIFKEDVPEILRLLGKACLKEEAPLRAHAPKCFLKLKVCKRTQVVAKEYSTKVPACLVGYIFGRKGENAKKIHADIGVELFLLPEDQRQCKNNCMVSMQLRFGDMIESQRLHAANRVLEALRTLFAKLYNGFLRESSKSCINVPYVS